MDVAEDETVGPHTDGLVNIFGKSTVSDNIAGNYQEIVGNFADRIRKDVDSAVTSVETRVHVMILSARDNVVIPGVEIAVR